MIVERCCMVFYFERYYLGTFGFWVNVLGFSVMDYYNFALFRSSPLLLSDTDIL